MNRSLRTVAAMCALRLAATCSLTVATLSSAVAQTPAPTPSATPAASPQTSSAAPAASPPPALVESVATDPAQPIQARVGQTFAIALRSNRTTGFSWQLATPPGTAIQTAGSAYEERSSLIGGGGQEIWLFQALAAGAATITLRYVRPFENGSAQMERAVSFHVDIAP